MKFLDLELTGVDGATLNPSWTFYPSSGQTICNDGLTVSGNVIVIEQNKLCYKIKNKNSGLVLGVLNMSKEAGGQIVQWGDNGTADHLWTLKKRKN